MCRQRERERAVRRASRARSTNRPTTGITAEDVLHLDSSALPTLGKPRTRRAGVTMHSLLAEIFLRSSFLHPPIKGAEAFARKPCTCPNSLSFLHSLKSISLCSVSLHQLSRR
jgi:hypothetical protein